MISLSLSLRRRSAVARGAGWALSFILLTGLASPAANAEPIFGPAALVAELNSSGSDSVNWISPDGLTVVIQSNRTGSFDLFSATRANLASPFSTPAAFPFLNVNSGYFNSTNGVISSDGLEAFFHGASSSTAQSFIRATRVDTASQFSAGSVVTTVPVTIPGATGGFNRPGWLSPDGERMYYFTDYGELKLATRDLPTTAFTPSAFDPFVTINAGGVGFTPTLSSDELSVIFHSNRVGTLGANDLWYASRASINDAFGAPTNLASLNTVDGEGSAVWFGDTLFFSRTVGGDTQIFQTSAVPEPSSVLLMLGGLALIGVRRRAKG